MRNGRIDLSSTHAYRPFLAGVLVLAGLLIASAVGSVALAAARPAAHHSGALAIRVAGLPRKERASAVLPGQRVLRPDRASGTPSPGWAR